MRIELVKAKNRKQAFSRCPWAAVIIKVEGGYKCFESMKEYKIWRDQNDRQLD
jgi:hypothetical protein